MNKNPRTFEEFLDDFTTNNCIRNSKTARKIYEIIWRDDIRIKMVDLSDVGISALTGCAKEIEYKSMEKSSDLSLNSKLIRQTIGRMCAASLSPLGYTPYKQGRVNAGHSEFFTSAKVYKYTGSATEKVEKKIVPFTGD